MHNWFSRPSTSCLALSSNAKHIDLGTKQTLTATFISSFFPKDLFIDRSQGTRIYAIFNHFSSQRIHNKSARMFTEINLITFRSMNYLQVRRNQIVKSAIKSRTKVQGWPIHFVFVSVRKNAVRLVPAVLLG